MLGNKALIDGMLIYAIIGSGDNAVTRSGRRLRNHVVRDSYSMMLRVETKRIDREGS